GNLVEMRAAIAKAQARWNCELDGAIHLAGIAPERPLKDETNETFVAVLHPKMTGVWVLHELLKDRPGTVMISFSSVNAFFGGMNFGAYAAANRFLDSFVEYQRRHSAVRSYCFNWSMWDQVGMNL